MVFEQGQAVGRVDAYIVTAVKASDPVKSARTLSRAPKTRRLSPSFDDPISSQQLYALAADAQALRSVVVRPGAAALCRVVRDAAHPGHR